MNAYYRESLLKGSNRVILLGCAYIVLGIAALAFASAVTFTAILTLGIVLAIAGVAEISYALAGRLRGQLWPHLMFGCLALICGALIVLNPLANALGFTLVAGFWLSASGLAKIVGSAVERSTGWGWYLANGIISVCLGGLVLNNLPDSAFWMIGTFLGADLLITGLAQIGLGVSAKRVRQYMVGETYSTLNPEPRQVDRDAPEQNPFH
jgi:uncharacterized membrane protein HdeD (DUF308 family)